MPAQGQFLHKLFHRHTHDTIEGLARLNDVMTIVEANYQEEPHMGKLSDEAIRTILRNLDPHCLYIPASEVERTNESLKGSFSGVGMTFNIIRDTVVVMDLLPDGTALKAGMQRGDRLVGVDNHSLLGDSLNNALVSKYVRGKKGEKSVFHIVRHGKPVDLTIDRQNTRLASVKPFFMVNDSVGYICIERFSYNTASEFANAIRSLKEEGMTVMMLDLRGNSGGYLDIAIGVANEFLGKGNLIVYTQGRKFKRREARATNWGNFRKGKVVVMLDENSASASEVVSGALQDWDRAVIVGRRSFGKGLVQHIFTLSDGGQVRVTTARYYTPSGRCIQKPYGDTINYSDDFNRRFKHGELFSADSIPRPDSLRYYTHAGRVVYGSGGIIPDIFVPLDTTRLNPFVVTVRKDHVVRDFAQDFADSHRDVTDTSLAFNLDSLFTLYAAAAGYTRDSLDADSALCTPARTAHSESYLHTLIRSEVAQRLFGTDHYYRVMKDYDKHFRIALEATKRNDI